MSTIDGTSFNITDITFKTTSKTFAGGAAGGDSNIITQSGYFGLDISLSGYAMSVSAYDSVMAALMSPGSHTLVLRTGWQYTVYADTNSIQQTGGFSDNYIPFSVKLVCADPYQYSTTTATRQKTITSTSQQWSQDDSLNNITTSGTVNAVPDIKITGAAGGTSTLLQQNNKFS